MIVEYVIVSLVTYRIPKIKNNTTVQYSPYQYYTVPLGDDWCTSTTKYFSSVCIIQYTLNSNDNDGRTPYTSWGRLMGAPVS